MYAKSVTFFNVHGNRGTEASAVITRVARAGVKFAIFIVFRWVDITVAYGKVSDGVNHSGASLDRPWSSVFVDLTWVGNGDSLGARVVRSPRISKV